MTPAPGQERDGLGWKIAIAIAVILVTSLIIHSMGWVVPP